MSAVLTADNRTKAKRTRRLTPVKRVPARATKPTVRSVPAALKPKATQIARRYLWWEPVAQVLRNLPRFLAHAMNLATWEDHAWLEDKFAREDLLDALRAAPAGTFTPKSWNFWYIRLGENVPPYPRKQVLA